MAIMHYIVFYMTPPKDHHDNLNEDKLQEYSAWTLVSEWPPTFKNWMSPGI